MAKIVNKRELGEIIGVSEQTLTTWQSEGCPMVTHGARGEENCYDTVAVITWRVERAVRQALPESQRDRLTRLQADLIDLQLAEKSKQLVPVDQVEPVWVSRVLAAAAWLQSQPSRLAGILEATPGIEAKRALLKIEFTNFLSNLGINGEAMWQALEELLGRLAESEREEFFHRISRGGE